jgi:hypothetical protein
MEAPTRQRTSIKFFGCTFRCFQHSLSFCRLLLRLLKDYLLKTSYFRQILFAADLVGAMEGDVVRFKGGGSSMTVERRVGGDEAICVFPWRQATLNS